MGWLFEKKENITRINWQTFSSKSQLKAFKAQSSEKLIIFFKHSTRCSISTMAKNRFERNWNYDESLITPVYLDIINHRDISDALEKEFGVTHQSPQILVIQNGKCIYSASHNQIDASKLSSFVN